MQGKVMAAPQSELDSIIALLDAMETCHICHGQISIEDVTHCENCSGDCNYHAEPKCESIFWLHHKAKIAVKTLRERMSFQEWWDKDGRFLDPDPEVGWYHKRRDFAELAYEAGRNRSKPRRWSSPGV